MWLIYIDDQALSETTREACDAESVQLTRQIKSRGPYLAANQLHPTSTATGVRVGDGKPLVTVGLFAETCEQPDGHSLIDANDLAEAIHIAARIPGARLGTVEIRPVMEIAGLPTDGGPRWAHALSGGTPAFHMHDHRGADGQGRDVDGRSDRARSAEASGETRREGDRADTPYQHTRQ